MTESQNPNPVVNMTEDQLAKNGRQLCELLSQYSALVLRGNDRIDWLAFAAGILGRCSYTLESILQLRSRGLDAAVLTRTLWEHAVTFAWVAIKPEENLDRFMRASVTQEQKMLADIPGLGLCLPSAPALEQQHELLELRLLGVKAAPPAPQRAKEADEFWGPVIGESPLFRGRYVTLFRFFSSFVHPTLGGVARFSGIDVDGGYASIEAVIASQAVGIFAEALMIAGRSLGWPPADRVLQLFVEGASVQRGGSDA